jgi:glycosyltransferase involved in cell wall biosynthesis
MGFYGAENVLATLAANMGTDFEPLIGIVDNRDNSHLELAAFAREHALTSMVFPCRSAIDADFFRSLHKFILNNHIDIVHSHGYKSDFYARMAAGKTNVAVVATCHPWIISNWRGALYAKIDRLNLRSFTKIAAVSKSVMRKLRQAGIQEEKISLIHNGIDLARFTNHLNIQQSRIKFDLAPRKCIIGSIGRLDPEKGHIHLVEAAAQIHKLHPDIAFAIAGTGSLQEHLVRRTLETGSSAFFAFPGFVKEISAFLAAIDIFVLPSLTEGMPMALLEALASKKPVIASAVGDIGEVIESGKSGLLIPPGDTQALVRALDQLLTHPDRANDLAETGYQRVRDHFSARCMSSKYGELYDRALADRRPRSGSDQKTRSMHRKEVGT